MTEPSFDLKRDGLGIALFALGAFFAVLGCVALWTAYRGGEPLEQGTGSAALANVWLASIGALPGLVVSAGFAFLGARMWLAARSANLLRNLVALLGLGLSLSLFCGALSQTAGGRFGDATGGLVAETTHPVAGMLAGLLAVALAVWLGWLRPARLQRVEPDAVRGPGALAIGGTDSGVSAAEAAALIPEDFHRALGAGRKKIATRPKPVAPASPYPEDVRLRGEIPAGAQPLAPHQDVRTKPEAAPQPASVYRWNAARTDEPVAAGEDLAAVEQLEEAFDAEPEADTDEPFRTTGAIEGTEAAGAPGQRHGLNAPPPAITEARGEVPSSIEVQPLAPLPQASWEQSNLFTEDEEPQVDAYGTPLALVDALRRSQQEVALAFAEEGSELVVAPAASVEADGASVAEVERAAIDTDLDAEDAGGKAQAQDEEDLDQGHEGAEDGLEDATEDVEDEEALEEELDEREQGEPAPADLAEDARGASEVERGLDPVDAGEEQRELTPVAPPASRAASVPDPIVRKTAAERDVVLQPQAATAERATKTPAGSAPRGRLLAEAGCLFVERGRVAVSMLQRQYGMDFDDACKVLDELQELGLIGPYLGGQRRDILLTREQWLERVAKV